LALVILLSAMSVRGDEDRRVPIVAGAVPVDQVTDAPYQGALREALRRLGYIDGNNIKFVARYANGDPAKLREIVRELIDLRPDVIVGDARLLKEATNTIPIVSPTMGDPVRTGLVASLARPGGNLTGLSAQSYDLWPKQLELAKELVPRLTRLAFLFDTNDEPDALNRSREFSDLARREGLTTLSLPISSYAEIQAALRTIEKARPQVVVVWSSPLLTQHRGAIIKAIGNRLPVISDGRFFAEAGALLTYSVDWPDLFRRSASYIDRILKGAKPGDLPIEQPTKFELVVNLRTAEALRIKMPQTIIVRADKIIR
jgi:putative tryptophan/tyrosine transport system substrate-binding protein